MLRAPALGLACLLLLSAAPIGSAVVGPPVTNEDPLSGYFVVWDNNSRVCTSSDPVHGIVGAPLLSDLTPVPSGSTTRWALHIRAMPTDAYPCPPIDLSFFAAIAPWPTTPTTRSVSAACGITGSFTVGPSASGTFAFFYGNVPAACGAGISGTVIFGLQIARLRPSEYMVCVPVAVSIPCAGAYEEQTAGPACQAGHRNGATYVTSYFGFARWCGQGDVVYLQHPLGLFGLEARRGSCRVVLYDAPDIDTTGVCPAALADLLWSQPWGAMLP